MKSNVREPRSWEIWSANVRFEEEPDKVKERPVLVFPDGTVYVAHPITSHVVRKNDPMDYPILKWQEAGLDHPSTLRLGKRIALKRADLHRCCGALAIEDVRLVQRALKQQVQRNRVK